MGRVERIRGPITGDEAALLLGRTIQSASVEPLGEWDDVPTLLLTMTDGSQVQIVAQYAGYTGRSEDEYPRYILIEGEQDA